MPYVAIPAQAGIRMNCLRKRLEWIPACAGMAVLRRDA